MFMPHQLQNNLATLENYLLLGFAANRRQRPCTCRRKLYMTEFKGINQKA
jgi:hypothetical protein